MNRIKIVTPNWPKLANIYAFTTIKGCAFTNLKLPPQQFWLKQEHGTDILHATASNCPHSLASSMLYGDGSYTKERNVACVVRTADCLPILVTNLQGTFVAAIHAGWRGLSKGILGDFFKKIAPLNLNNTDLLFWFGPAIGALAFEVGSEVVDLFKDHQAAFQQSTNPNKFLANIYQIAMIDLNRLKISNQQIFTQNYCTYSQNNRFYSYRRDPLSNDRMYSFIWIK